MYLLAILLFIVLLPAAILLGFSLFALIAQRILQSLNPSPD